MAGALGVAALVGAGSASLAACESADPIPTTLTTATTSTGPGGEGGAAVAGNGGTGGSTPQPCSSPDANASQQDNPTCQPLAGDFEPGSSDDGWDACISDDGAYHPFDVSISSLARVAAFEQVSDLLGFGKGTAPSPQGFLAARVIYSQEEGLESRVSRREDEHYPAAPKQCNEMTAAELQQYADRCVGPARIQPLLNAAFKDGIDGVEPVLNAARIEAGLLWFLYVSPFKEARTCASKPNDCDSSYAYYTGGEPVTGGLGLGRYVRARSVQAHERVWDGILAVRCWRDLDNPTGEAQDLTLRDAAVAQLDRALLRGVALIVRQRAAALPCEAGWVTVQTLGAVLDREAIERDPAVAAVLRTEVGKPAEDEVDVVALTGAIDTLFPCP